MIPKRIFYVWGYNEPKSRLADICIENWRDKLPDFEIIEINEKTPQWFDFDSEYKNNLWFKTVYDLKMWAYVSDYMRVKTVYNHGGIYFDTDVTVYKDFTPLLEKDFFVGQSFSNIPDPSVFGAIKHHIVLEKMLEFYDNDIFKSPNYVITHILKNALQQINPKTLFDKTNTVEFNNIVIYPQDYFQPFYYIEQFDRSCITKNTFTVHWQTNSWMSKKNLYFLSNKHRLPLKTLLKQLEFIEKIDTKANKKVEVTK